MFCNCNNFIIGFPLIDHSHNSQDFCFHDTQWLDINTAYDENVNWIMVFAVGLGDESIIGGIVNSTKQDSIKFEKPTIFVKFIFSLGSTGNFNNSIDKLRRVLPIWNIMPWVFRIQTFLHFLRYVNLLKNLNMIQDEKGERDPIYSGIITQTVYLESITPSYFLTNQRIDQSSQGKINALKYRHPLKYLGPQYSEVVVPCIPALELVEVSEQPMPKCQYSFIKVNYETQQKATASGKRSAILTNANHQLIRLKGCGNEAKGFNREGNETRGHHFFHTAKRELFMTKLINNALKDRLNIHPPANVPKYAFNIPEKQISQLQLANDLPSIEKYCCVFETQGDRRAGTHLISSLEVIYLSLFNHSQAGWPLIFQANKRMDSGEIVEFVTNFELTMEPGKKFIDIYDQSSEIQNYVLLSSCLNLTLKQNAHSVMDQIIKKFVPISYQEKVQQLAASNQSLLKCIHVILMRIGWEMGRVKRVMCEQGISWGFFHDHGVQWHCNAHLNNFIVSQPKSSNQSSNYFLLPLDYDLAYTKQEFICIEESSPEYGFNSQDQFENSLCAQHSAMQMSLLGLELMNFKYGIGDEEQNNAGEKMGRIAFRDTLVHAFAQGMRNKQQFYQSMISEWDSNIKSIEKVVEACLYISMSFQT